MKQLFMICISFLFIACSNKGKHSNDEGNVLNNNQSKLIEGIWAENEEENALFLIEKDSIFYFDSDERVYYEYKNDSLQIYYDGYTAKNLVNKLNQDSLVFTTESGYVNRLYRRK